MGKTIGTYELHEVLGTGSRTTVYRGSHGSISGLQAAIKVLHPGLSDLEEVRGQLRQEAALLARLRHPHIVRVLDFVEEGELCALAVELAPGRSLREHLVAADEVISVRRVLRIFRTMADALGHAHGVGLVHGQLDPSAVMLSDRDDVKLLDFGRVGMHSAEPSPDNLPYRAPESRSPGTEATARGDLYSLARLVEGLLLGREVRERQATSAALMEAGAPEGLVELLRKMARETPEERPGSCGEVLAALDRLSGSRINRVPVQRLQLGDCKVDLLRQEVTRGDEAERLTTNETNLLRYLSMNPGRVVTRDQLMRDVWGTRGQVVTRAVDVAVRRLRKKIEPDPADPRFILTVHGQGYRYEPPESLPTQLQTGTHPPVQVPPADGGGPQLPSSPPTPPLISGDGRTVQGRGEALADLAALFSEGARLVTVTGPGGMGKTLLARVFAEERPPAFLDEGSSWFCDLQAVRDEEGLVRTVAGTLGMVMAPALGADDVERIGRDLANRGPCLVLLDNFEQLVTSSSRVVASWLQAAPEARFLITSQALLGIPGERVYELAPLDEEAALALFVDRARELRYDFQPEAEEQAQIRAIVTALDRIPLAIELAASRIRMLSTQQLQERLAQRFDLLRARSSAGGDRSSTLRGAIEWSWQLLSPEEQQALAQTTIFAGGFSAEAAEAVIDLPQSDDFVLDLLQSLVDKSLLRCVTIAGLPGLRRFVFFESIYAFASEHLAAMTSLGALAFRHREYYLAEAERLGALRDGDRGLEASRLLELEVDNLLLIESQCALGESEVAVRITLVLEPLLHERGPPGVYSRLLNSAIDHAEGEDPGFESTLLYKRTLWNRTCGPRLDELEADIARIEALARESEQPLDAARAALYRVGASLIPAGSISEAEALVTAVRDTILAEGEPRDIHRLHKHLSHCAEWLGRLDEAEAHTQAALEVAQAAGLRRHEAECLRRLAVVSCNTGRLEESERVLREAIAIHETFENWRSIASCLGLLGEVVLMMGRHDDCELLVQQSRKLAEQVGDTLTPAMLLGVRGRIALDRGELATAIQHFQDSLPGLGGWRVGQAISQVSIALAQLQLGEPQLAADQAEVALQILTPDTNSQARLHALCALAMARHGLSLTESATEALVAGRELAETLGEVEQAMIQVCAEQIQPAGSGEAVLPPERITELQGRSCELRALLRLVDR